MATKRHRRGGRRTRRYRGKCRRHRGKRRRYGGKSTTKKKRGGLFYRKCFTNLQCKTAKGEICDHTYIPFGIRYGLGDGTCRNRKDAGKCSIM